MILKNLMLAIALLIIGGDVFAKAPDSKGLIAEYEDEYRVAVEAHYDFETSIDGVLFHVNMWMQQNKKAASILTLSEACLEATEYHVVRKHQYRVERDTQEMFGYGGSDWRMTKEVITARDKAVRAIGYYADSMVQFCNDYEVKTNLSASRY